MRSATWEGMAAEDGACTPKCWELAAKLAALGVLHLLLPKIRLKVNTNVKKMVVSPVNIHVY